MIIAGAGNLYSESLSVRLSCDSISVTKRCRFFCAAANSVRNAIAVRQVIQSRVQKRNSLTSYNENAHARDTTTKRSDIILKAVQRFPVIKISFPLVYVRRVFVGAAFRRRLSLFCTDRNATASPLLGNLSLAEISSFLATAKKFTFQMRFSGASADASRSFALCGERLRGVAHKTPTKGCEAPFGNPLFF